MNPRVKVLGALTVTLLALPVACSSGEDDSAAGGPSDDGGVVDAPISTGDDATTTDAGTPDAGDDSATVAKICSDDDVCHTLLPPKSLVRDVWSAGDGVVWSVTWSEPQLIASPGSILRWDGKAWTEVYKDPLRLHAVWGTSATDIWVGGDSGLFHGTGPSSDMLTWKKVLGGPITTIWGTDANDVWAAGGTLTAIYQYDGKVFHYSGTGSVESSDAWELDPISTSRSLSGFEIWGSSKDDVWLSAVEANNCSFCTGGTRGLLYRRRLQDGVMIFVQESAIELGGNVSSTGSLIASGASFGPDHVWFGANIAVDWDPSYDALFTGTKKTDGSGDFDWSHSSFDTCRSSDGRTGCKGIWYTRAIWGTSENDVYIAGDGGQLRHWDGTKFSFVKTTVQQIPESTNFTAMWGSSSTDLWIVGDNIALHKIAHDPSGSAQ